VHVDVAPRVKGILVPEFSPSHYSAEGRVSGYLDESQARLWDSGGRLLATLGGDARLVTTGAVFSPDGGRILTASTDNTAQLWDRYRYDKPLATLEGHSGAVRSAVFAPTTAAS
jgi:WD40 repeat protein